MGRNMKTIDYEVADFPKARLATMDVGKLGLAKHYMFGLLEVDVTDARQRARNLRHEGRGPSFTAWILKTIGDCIAENKYAQAMLLHRRRLIVFNDVDIAIPVERPIGDRGVPLPLLIKAVNRKSVFEIQQELEAAVHQRIVDEKDYILSNHLFSKMVLKLYYRLPQWARMLSFKWLFNSPFRARKHSGTVLVTTVNAIGKSAGWILPTRSLHNLSIALGSITKKPWVVNSEVKVRDIMHMTVTFNHDVIDGVPARRFVENLVGLIEKGNP